jgi:hypothetical protein
MKLPTLHEAAQASHTDSMTALQKLRLRMVRTRDTEGLKLLRQVISDLRQNQSEDEQDSGMISIGDQVQCVEDNWQGRVTGFDNQNGVTMLVCHHVCGNEIELDDKRWFDPRDVRLIRKAYNQ